jgi:GTPase SAR1 family protein
MNRGILVCVAGADASGKTTIINRFIEKYNKSEKWVVFKYPNRSTVLGKKINKILKGKLVVSKEVEIKMFADNRAEDKNEILNLLNNGVNVILDRYTYCSLAYTMTSQYKFVMDSMYKESDFKFDDSDLISDKFLFRKILNCDKGNLKPDFTFLIYGNFLHLREDIEIYDYTDSLRDVLYNNYIVAFLNTNSRFCSIYNKGDKPIEELVKNIYYKINKYGITVLRSQFTDNICKPVERFN